MPAAMESSPNPPKTLEILWKSPYFLQISSKMFFFSGNLGKSPRISRICSEISPAGLGISRPGSRSLGPAEILRISQPRKIGFRRCPYRQIFFLVGCMVSKSLIPDVLEFRELSVSDEGGRKSERQKFLRPPKCPGRKKFLV